MAGSKPKSPKGGKKQKESWMSRVSRLASAGHTPPPRFLSGKNVEAEMEEDMEELKLPATLAQTNEGGIEEEIANSPAGSLGGSCPSLVHQNGGGNKEIDPNYPATNPCMNKEREECGKEAAVEWNQFLKEKEGGAGGRCDQGSNMVVENRGEMLGGVQKEPESKLPKNRKPWEPSSEGAAGKEEKEGGTTTLSAPYLHNMQKKVGNGGDKGDEADGSPKMARRLAEGGTTPQKMQTLSSIEDFTQKKEKTQDQQVFELPNVSLEQMGKEKNGRDSEHPNQKSNEFQSPFKDREAGKEKEVENEELTEISPKVAISLEEYDRMHKELEHLSFQLQLLKGKNILENEGKEGHKEQDQRNWAAVVKEGDQSSSMPTKTSSKANIRLDYYEPTYVKGKKKVVIPKEVAEKGRRNWQTTLVGFFLNGRPAIPQVIKESMLKWKSKGLEKVLATDQDYFFFKFNNEEGMKEVMEEEMITMLGRTLLLQPWKEGNTYQKKDQDMIPTWCKVTKIPMEIWTRDGISHIASAIGQPLCVDTQTAKLERASFARICVMVAKDQEIERELELEIEGGITTFLEVEAQKWYKPGANNPIPKERKMWRPKVKEMKGTTQKEEEDQNKQGETGEEQEPAKEQEKEEVEGELSIIEGNQPEQGEGKGDNDKAKGEWQKARRRKRKHLRAGQASLEGGASSTIQPTTTNMVEEPSPPPNKEGMPSPQSQPLNSITDHSTHKGPLSTPQNGSNG